MELCRKEKGAFYRVKNGLGNVTPAGYRWPLVIVDHVVSAIDKVENSESTYRVTVTIKAPTNTISLSGGYDFVTYSFDCLGTVQCTKTQNGSW